MKTDTMKEKGSKCGGERVFVIARDCDQFLSYRSQRNPLTVHTYVSTEAGINGLNESANVVALDGWYENKSEMFISRAVRILKAKGESQP